MNIFSWLYENMHWLFGGAGITVLAAFSKWAWNKFQKPVNYRNDTIVYDDISSHGSQSPNILFVDDKNFPIVSTLQKNGWPNTRRISDIKNLRGSEVQNALVLFIDIQGVGKALNFPDEGLGLAQAVKNEYPNKKVVIYSANTHGNMFHPALNQVDATLPKNASTYQFVQLIEQFTQTP